MKRTTKSGGRKALPVLASLAMVTTLGLGIVGSGSTAAGATPLPDGSTSFNAAASCWEVKQNKPTAPNGVYWLVTPRLVAPEQFYCDMTTDGGGWVLVGRGREGWSPQYEGVGTPAQVRAPITGPDAFAPRELSSRTIDGLLNGARVDGLADGVRLRRATNAGGTAWQEARFKFARRDRWAWSLGAENPLASWRFGATTGTGGQTATFGSDTGYNRLDTRESEAQGWLAGMAYGTSVTGRKASTSYLWSRADGQGGAMPFTQMFLRPRLRLADLAFPSVPDSGTAAQENSPLASTGAKPNPWGVTGLANGRDNELTTEVAAFTQIGSTVYVGGNFRYVQKGATATGADKVEQPYLAAFDAQTGNWVSGFRPVLNGQVKSLAVLPNGLLVAGGEFTTANGQPAAAAVALDPSTGKKSASWDVQLENHLTGALLQVRALRVAGGWLYLGGGFTHVSGGPSRTRVYARAAARVSVTDGTPDGSWNPDFNGTVVAMDTSASGDKIYAAGYFGTAKGLAANRAAELSPVTASPNQAWKPVWSNTKNTYQQGLNALGSRVWVGGAEHSLFSWDTGSFARMSGTITKQGGDFQTVGDNQGTVYASCHCGAFAYTDAYTWSNLGTTWTQADKVGWVGGWDATTGKFIPDFDPVLKTRRGSGGWAVLTDSTGTTWFGGDFTRAMLQNGSLGWTGGFVRFAPRDTAAPGTPADFVVASNGTTGARLRWSPSDGAAQYEVIRENQVVATTSSTLVDVPAVSQATRYFVRAVDAAGNRSASTSALTVEPASGGGGGGGTPPVGGVLVDTGSTWRWRYDAAAWPAGWNQTSFDDSTWKQGPAVLGFGSTQVVTNIDFTPETTTDRPLSAQFRRSFDVADPSALSTVTVYVRADDAVVVYVNGTEVGRANLPTGTLTQSTYASSSPRTTTASASPVTFVVPTSLLVPGRNVVAASVHLGYRSTPDVSFDLEMDAS